MQVLAKPKMLLEITGLLGETMLRDFNILATTSRGNERLAISELRYLLGEVGDATPDIRRTGVSGVIVGKTSLNPVEMIEKFRSLLHERPYEFRFTLRIVPIRTVIQTDLTEIEKTVSSMSSEIRENETFRVTVEKRFTQIHSREIIDTAAACIKRNVDLTNPDKTVLIEVVGRLTGISIIKPEQMLSVLKEKVL